MNKIEIFKIIDYVKKHYDEKIFAFKTNAVDNYTATGARIACELLKKEIAKAFEEKRSKNG